MKKSFLNWAGQIGAASYGVDEALAGGCRFMRLRPSMQCIGCAFPMTRIGSKTDFAFVIFAIQKPGRVMNCTFW
jgi:hypothetical protein